MLELKDFYHLPQVDTLLSQLAADEPGLIVVAGLDPRPPVGAAAGDRFLPSGRSAIFRILMRLILAARPRSQAIVVAESEEAIRLPRQVRRQVTLSLVDEVLPYAQRITAAARKRPDLLVIDRLCAENAPAAWKRPSAACGSWPSSTPSIAAPRWPANWWTWACRASMIHTLRWVVAVQRLATLCPVCKQPTPASPTQMARLQRLYPNLDLTGSTTGEEEAAFCHAPGCAACGYSGREGEVAAFDIYPRRPRCPRPVRPAQPAAGGGVPVRAWRRAATCRWTTCFTLKTDQLRRTYGLLASSEQALARTNAALEAKLAELEAANRVLQQRTEALISLQGIGQALITSTSLDELAGRLCRHACDLCGAERAILYAGPPRRADGRDLGRHRLGHGANPPAPRRGPGVPRQERRRAGAV